MAGGRMAGGNAGKAIARSILSRPHFAVADSGSCHGAKLATSKTQEALGQVFRANASSGDAKLGCLDAASPSRGSMSSACRSSRLGLLKHAGSCNATLGFLGCRGYSSRSGKDQDDGDEEDWCEDLDGANNLDPDYKPRKRRQEPKMYGFPGDEDKKYSDDEEYSDDDEGGKDGEEEEEIDLKDLFGSDYENSPFGRSKVPFEKWSELKKQYDALSAEELENMDGGGDEPLRRGKQRKADQNPNEHKHYRTKPKTPVEEERMRKFKEERDRYLRIMNQWDFTPRFFSPDPHVERVKAKLANLKPGPDGKYRNLMEYISDIDILLYAYRVVKARKLGPGTECTTIPVDNIKMDWFYKMQKQLRDGTFKWRGEKIVYVKKKSFKK